jgi:hypothetical protein
MQRDFDASPAERQQSLWDLFGLALVLAATLFVYRGAFEGFFVQDDFGWLHDSRFESFSSYFRCFFRFNPAQTFRPLSQEGFFWLGQTLFGMWPPGFHAMSLALHLAGVSLLFVLLRLFTSPAASLAGALFFAVHSAHFRSVYWISAAPEPMAVLFYLSGVLGFVQFDRTGSRGYYWLSLASMVVGLMAKESILTLPLVLAAYAVAFGRKRLVWGALPHLALTAAYWIFRALSGHVSSSPYALTLGRETAEHFLTYAAWTGAFSESLLKLTGRAPQSSYPICGALVLLIAAALFVKSTDRRLASWAVIWFVLALQPVLYFSEQVYPYYLGSALPGFALLLTSALPQSGRAGDWLRRLPVAGLVGLAAFTSYESVASEGRWWNERSFIARDVIRQMPEVDRQTAPGRIAFLFGFGPTELGAMQNDAALWAYGYRPDRFILVGLDRITYCHLENLKKHGGLGDYYCFLYSNGKLENETRLFRANPDSFIRLKPLELLPDCSPGGSFIRLAPESREVTAGKGMVAFRVLDNLKMGSVDVAYTFNGALMPVLTDWRLQPDGTARVFVDANTPRGRYVYHAIRNSADVDIHRWLPACVEITVR